MQALKAHRYQINCKTLAPLKLNDYSGSMLRGAFGRALYKQACVTKMDNCQQCLLFTQCAYPNVFATPAPKQSALQKFSAIPNPFIIEPPPMGEMQLKKGERFSFNLVLIGQAISHLPLIIYAWEKALQNGLGKEKASVSLDSIVFEPKQAAEQIIYNQQKILSTAPEFRPPNTQALEEITLKFITPLHIKKHGKVMAETLTARDFLMALIRRYYLLQEFHGKDYEAPDFTKLAKNAEQINCQADLQWYEWQRYSSRQKQKMTFGGVIGTIKLSGELTAFLDILQSGQWLHVGSKTTFGMGRYQII